MATDLERLIVQLSADITRYEKAMNRAQGVANSNAKAIEDRVKRLNVNVTKQLEGIGKSATSSLDGALSSITALAGSVFGAAEIARYADEWVIAGNKINSAATSVGARTRTLSQLNAAANEARSDLASYTDLYARFIRTSTGIAKNEEEIALATALVAKSFKAGGAAASEQAAGILQLGQALGSGVLQGDELRSLRENAPILADAIAKEFKVTIAGLKDLGSQGKLTSDRVFKAILAAQKPIENQFNATRSTISDALTRVNNNLLEYVGTVDATSGASLRLVEAINYVADNFGTAANVVINFATVIAGALVGKGLASLVGFLGRAIAAIGTFITVARGGAVAAGLLTTALGPIGVLAGAAGAALYALNANFNAAETAVEAANRAYFSNKEALDAARGSSVGFTAALRQQIAVQLAATESAAALAEVEADAAIARAQTFRRLARSIGVDATFDPLEYAAKQADARAQQITYAASLIKEQLAEVDKSFGEDGGYGGGGPKTDGSGKKGKLNEYEREIKSIREKTAATIADTEAQSKLNPLINDYGYAVKRAAAYHDLITAAKSADLALTPKLVSEIEKTADAYALSAVAAAKLDERNDKIKENYRELLDLQKNVTRGLVDDLLEGTSAADAFANALKRIGSALLDQAFTSLFSPASSGGLGGFGGIFKALGFAKGGYTGPGGTYEPAGIVHKGEYVVPKNIVDKVGVSGIEKRLAGYNLGGLVGGSTPRVPAISSASQTGGVNFNYSPRIDARGADVAAVARLEAGQERMRREFEARAVAAVQKAKGSNVKV